MITTAIHELVRLVSHMAVALTALKAPPPSDPPRLRVGFGGDIPIAPPIAMLVLVLLGFCAQSLIPYLNRSVFDGIVSTEHIVAARVGVVCIVSGISAQIKKQTDIALLKAGTKAEFTPVPAIANTDPYAVCRNAMYWALMGLVISIGAAADSFCILFGSSMLLWLYLDLVVVPAEERFLERELGEPYKRYCATVKRWSPI